jgi:hypothetical protein
MGMTSGEIVPDIKQQTLQLPTLMLTIVWNPSGFHIVKALRKGGKFSAQYYTNNILIALSDWRRLAGERSPNKVWVHADNARPHNAKVPTDFIALNRMKQALIHHIHRIWHHLTSSFLATSKESSWNITLRVRPSFLTASGSFCRKSRGRH